jgi:hypothetical protein
MIAMPALRELPWLKPSHIPADTKIITNPQQTLIASNADEAFSDTGELARNWRQGTFTINTPRTQAAMGWIGGKTIKLADVEFDITTRNAVVAVQSLDNDPINSATSLMISLGARSIPDKSDTTFRSEPVVGELTIWARRGLRFYRREGDIQLATNVPATYANGRYQIALETGLHTYWLLMK